MSDRLRTWIVVGLASLLVWIPEAAWACAVCTAGRDDETRTAFLLTTVFLSVLPLIMIGGMAWWLTWHARAQERSPAGEERPVRLSPVSRASSSP